MACVKRKGKWERDRKREGDAIYAFQMKSIDRMLAKQTSERDAFTACKTDNCKRTVAKGFTSVEAAERFPAESAKEAERIVLEEMGDLP